MLGILSIELAVQWSLKNYSRNYTDWIYRKFWQSFFGKAVFTNISGQSKLYLLKNYYGTFLSKVTLNPVLYKNLAIKCPGDLNILRPK